MKIHLIIYVLILNFLILLNMPVFAQDESQYDAWDLKAAIAPPDTTIEPQLAEYLVYDNHGSDRTYEIKWQVNQVCFLGGDVEVWVYRGSTQFYHQKFTGIPWLGGAYSTTGWTNFYAGPEQSVDWKLVVRNAGTLCAERWRTLTCTAKTLPLKTPTNVTATNASSDKNVLITWKNASDNIPQFNIFRDQTLIATVGGEQYLAANIPDKYVDKTYTWYVQATYAGKTSNMASSTAKVFAYKKPYNLTADRDSTIGYIGLNWKCDSDYATHFRIYRNDTLLTTLAKAQNSYRDSSATPRTEYNYEVTAYNLTDNYESLPSNTAVGRAVFFIAYDGTDMGLVRLSWTKFPVSYYSDMKLFRDNAQIDPIDQENGHKDYGAQPGKIHKYTLQIFRAGKVILELSDYGFAPSNGKIAGKVTTSSLTGGVLGVEMRAYPHGSNLNSSLNFDGINDFIKTPPLNLNSNTVTMTAWIKCNGQQADWAGILCSREKDTMAGLYIMANGELRYNWNNNTAAYGWSSGLIVPVDQWTFIALVIRPDRATLYMNDTQAVNAVTHEMEQFNGSLEIGRDNFNTTGYFKGNIDEICIWNTARNSDQVLTDMHHILVGDEAGLKAYWRFNLGFGTVAGDYAVGGNHHGQIFGNPVWSTDVPKLWHYNNTLQNGSYEIARINWADNTEFVVRPFKAGHGFKGSDFAEDSLKLPFTNEKYEYTGINFIDTTSIEVSGYVLLNKDLLCPIPNVQILLDDDSTNIYTDSLGHYNLTVGEAGNYKITPEFFNHQFMPADTTFDIHDAVIGLDFLDTTKSELTGVVAGGCGNFLGIADIHIKSIFSDCIDTTLITDGTGAFKITLPAQPYLIQLSDIDNPDKLDIINYFEADTVDLSFQDSVYNIIYHSPPQFTLSGLPDPPCPAYDIPILNQEEGYQLSINVFEKYGDIECPTAGKVILHDKMAYEVIDSTITFQDGVSKYKIIPGYPNLSGGGVHPYQKMLVINIEANKYTVKDTLWAFVRGQKPREFQFATVSPEIPLLILRDPPGDQSYSYLSKTTTSSVEIGFSYESVIGAGVFLNFKVGGGGDVPGLGSTGAWVGGSLEANMGLRNTIEGTQEIKISASQMLRTSDSDQITGAAGDVFMGAALNIIYAKTDILDFDEEKCIAVRDTGIVWNGNGFKTTYLYTESHIRQNVIPGLQTMADILNSSGNELKKDSAEVLLNQVDVWQQILDYNDELKNNADLLKNISFSAGSSLQEEASITSTKKLSVGLYLFIDASVALSVGAKAGDFNEVEGGVKVFTKFEVGVFGTLSHEITNTVGYVLDDNDTDPPGDYFTLNVNRDLVYGTPVFELLSGVSSCPWEHPTLPREGVGLTMNTFELNDVPPEVPAQFDLYLYNLSQNDETRTYNLSLVQGSNPDGAIISVGGAVLGDDELKFPMEPNRDNPQKATIRVKREVGSVFDYEGLKLHLYSPCDAQIDTAVGFSVHFIKPCSDIRIVQPNNNWVLNTNSDSTLLIVLKDYDKSNSDMDQVKCEYRKAGEENDWNELFSYVRTLLPDDSITYRWDLSTVAEGPYELRASTNCSAGTYYTRTNSGFCDFSPPVVFGSPQPADKLLDAGDEIMIEFNEEIDPATITQQNIFMINISKVLPVDITMTYKDEKIIIKPKNQSDMVEGDTMHVVVDSLKDLHGNFMTGTITWDFVVNILTLIPEETAQEIPTHFALDQNYPNPFNPETTIRFAIPHTVTVNLVIYDITGKQIAKLVSEQLAPGFYNITFNGRNYSTGIYFYRLTAGSFVQTKKLILIK